MAKTRISRSQYTAVADILTNNGALSEYAKERALGRLNELVIVTNDPASLRNDPAVLALARQYAQSMPYGEAAVRAAQVIAQERNVPWVPDAWQVSQMSDESRAAYMQSEAFADEANAASGRGTRAQQVATEALEYAIERQQERDRYVDEHIRPVVVKQRKELLEAAATVPDTGDPSDLRRIEALMDIPSEEQWVGMLASKHFDYDPAADIATYSPGQLDQYLRDSAELRGEPVSDAPEAK